MRKKSTLAQVEEALLGLQRAMESYTLDNDARWSENNQLLSVMNRRLAQVEDGQLQLGKELQAMECRMNVRFDRLDARVAAVES